MQKIKERISVSPFHQTRISQMPKPDKYNNNQQNKQTKTTQNPEGQLSKSLKTELTSPGCRIPCLLDCLPFSLMMFSINYQTPLLLLEQIFRSHFLLSVAFLLCFSECYKNTQTLCFLRFLIESLIFLLLFPTLSSPFHWINKGNQTELCRQNNNIKLAYSITSEMAMTLEASDLKENGNGSMFHSNLLVVLMKQKACHFICLKDRVKNWPSSFVLKMFQNTTKYVKSIFFPNRLALQSRVFLFSFKIMTVSPNHRVS